MRPSAASLPAIRVALGRRTRSRSAELTRRQRAVALDRVRRRRGGPRKSPLAMLPKVSASVKRLRFLDEMLYSAASMTASQPETFSRRPTMKEVATLAGVSLATVSRVVNGDGKVRPDLAERVREAVALLGYRRDLTATNLRRADRHSASLGLVFDDVANPFHAALLRGVESVARTRGVLPLVGSSDEDPARERELAEAFLARRVDGLIVVPAGSDHSYLRPERDAGVALVFVDRPPAFIDADCVLSDNAGGGYAATAHLIARGHRRIAFLGDQEQIYTAAERLRGHREALFAHGVPHDPALVRMGLHDSELGGGRGRGTARRGGPAHRGVQRAEPDHHRRDRAAAYAGRRTIGWRSWGSTT